MRVLLSGAIAMSCLVAGWFFLRFWRDTRDRFFLFFAISFWIEAADRVIIGLVGHSSEQEPFFYLIRAAGYGLIVVAILDKNRSART